MGEIVCTHNNSDPRRRDTATPCHDHHQPRHLPHVAAAGVHLLGRRHTHVDLPQGTAAPVLSSETMALAWRDGGLRHRYRPAGTAEDSAYYNATLLVHAPPTAFTTLLGPAFDDPTAVTTTPPSPYTPKERACDIPRP